MNTVEGRFVSKNFHSLRFGENGTDPIEEADPGLRLAVLRKFIENLEQFKHKNPREGVGMLGQKLLVGISVLVVMGVLIAQQPQETTGRKMAEAANSFLASIGEDARAQATFDFDDKERLNWHFIPRERKGLPLKKLEGDALKAAHTLIQSGLSTSGYDQTLNVMSLEEILYLLEPGDRGMRRERRDPGKYYISIFGEPGPEGSWGWRLEGHHLSLNFTLKDGKVVSSTPEFFGANPGSIEAGPGRQIRVLGREEDLARELLKDCTDETRKLAHLDPKAPDDLRGANAPQAESGEPVGLKYGDMSKAQQMLLRELIGEYLANMPEEVSKERRAKIENDGFAEIYFAWWGDTERNQRHYYRIQGPSFIIEYNNTQNEANHVHSMWRSLEGDFAVSK